MAIAPLMCLDRELWAWLGYREEWDDADKASSGRRLSFRTVALTIHFGHRNDVKKPQMFRAEWAGWARWNGNDFSFQASDAAHPHWQFDALESLLTQDSEDPASTYLRQLKEETGSDLEEFVPRSEGGAARNMVLSQELSRIHFASAAAWWKTAPNDNHAHQPRSVAELENWLDRSLAYLSAELGRLVRA